jgi:hypothetical protein
VTDERQLDPRHLVVERVPRHTEVLRGRVDIEPARLDGRTCSRGGFAQFLCSMDGRDDVSRFHWQPLEVEPRCRWGGRLARRYARRLACGPEPPSGSAALLTAMALSRGYLESARATGFTGGNLRLNKSKVFRLEASPRRSAQDGASGEESMLPLDSLGVNASRSLANQGN